MAIAPMSDETLESPWPKPVLRLIRDLEPRPRDVEPDAVPSGDPPVAERTARQPSSRDIRELDTSSPLAGRSPEAELVMPSSWVSHGSTVAQADAWKEPEKRVVLARPVSAARRARTFKRRRRTAAGGLLVGLILVLAAPIGALGGGSIAPRSSVLDTPARNAAQVYVVRPGDTLRSIAAHVSGRADPGPLLGALSAQLGSTKVSPGQHLIVP